MNRVRATSGEEVLPILAAQSLKRQLQGSYSRTKTEDSCVSIFMRYFDHNFEGFSFLKYTVPLAIGGLGVSLLLSALAAVIKITALSLLILPTIFRVVYEGCQWIGWNPMLAAPRT